MAGLKVQHEGMAEPSLGESQTAISGDESQGTPHVHDLVLSPVFTSLFSLPLFLGW